MPNYQLPICFPMTTPPPTTSEPSTPPLTTRMPTFDDRLIQFATIVGAVSVVLIIIILTLIILVALIFIIKQSKVFTQQSHDNEMTRVHNGVVSCV